MDPNEEFFTKFKADVEHWAGQGGESIVETKHDIEKELYHMTQGRLPPERCDDVIRMHVVMSLAMNDTTIIKALEEVVEQAPGKETWRLLWSTHRYLGNEELAERSKSHISTSQ